MTVPTNTRQSYKSDGTGAGVDPAPGIREDLSNIIYNISPEETPFMSGIGRSSCDNTYFEWQIDTLDAADVTNRQVEGDNATALQAVEPLRVGNYTQISTKTVQSSGTAEAVDFAGRKSTQAYQMAKRAKELKIDMEQMLLEAATAPAPGTSSTARSTGSVGAWITSNAVAAGGPVAEADIRDIMEMCWTAGAKPDILMCDGAIKMAISQLSQSVSDLRTTANNQSPAFVVAAVDVYVSDFGNLKIVPNRCMPAETAYFLDYEYWDTAYLRPFATHQLSRTGDSESQLLVVEYGLRSKNEEANGKITGWTVV